MSNFSFKSFNDCKNSINLINHHKYNSFKTIFKFAADKNDIIDLINTRNTFNDKIKRSHKKSNKGKRINKIKNKIKRSNNNINTNLNKKLFNTKFYSKQNSKSFQNTLLYLFYKMGSGIFVKIINNKIKMFYPFYNLDYINNFDLKFKNAESFKEFLINKRADDYEMNISKWQANGCLLHPWKQNNINDGRWAEYFDMFDTLCKNKKINDIEFFINYKDFPSLNINLNEPNFFIFNNKDTNLNKCKFDTYLPIFSCYSSSLYADIMIPTYTEWKMISKQFYPSNGYMACENKQISIKKIDWDKKIPTAIFRGSATGCGINTNTNQRLHISLISHNWKSNKLYNEFNPVDKIPYLNAGVVSFNARYKKDFGEKVDIINPKLLGFDKVEHMTRDQQQQYKYTVYIDGHVTAERLITELDSGNLILKVDSLYNWSQWFHVFLKPFVHYIPVKKDLSDLADKIKWCKTHDKECYEITINAKRMYSFINNKKIILNYLKSILDNFSK
jgi:hypothetical protein